jgi:COMPASS component SWD2
VSSDNGNGDHAVRYLSLYDNSFLRFFKGHTDKVISIAMNPVDDCFMTGSTDRSVRLWNLSVPDCLAVLQFPLNSGAPHVAYDPQVLPIHIRGLSTVLLSHRLTLPLRVWYLLQLPASERQM